MTLLDQLLPKEEKEEPELVERRNNKRYGTEIETEEIDCKRACRKVGQEISVPMDELVEEGRKKQQD